jgi:hypothetical protein
VREGKEQADVRSGKKDGSKKDGSKKGRAIEIRFSWLFQLPSSSNRSES